MRLNCLFLMGFLVASPAAADTLTNVTKTENVSIVRATEILMPRETEEQQEASYNWVDRISLHKRHGVAFTFTEIERTHGPALEFDILGPIVKDMPGLGFAIRF